MRISVVTIQHQGNFSFLVFFPNFAIHQNRVSVKVISSPMASIPTLPDEIMVEILLKLPVKSILRCSSLSKHYYSLIRSQYFIRRHLNANLYDHVITRPMLGSVSLFDGRGRFIVLEGLPPIFGSSSKFVYHKIFGPVNGLYCLIYEVDCHPRFAVWNPSTREIFNVPCDFGSFSAFGFGYDDTTNDYKLVLILDSNEDIIIERSSVLTFYIMNISKGGEWGIPEQQVCFEAWVIETAFGVFTCGALHWIYASSNKLDYSIIALDMSTESHRIIAFPNVGDGYQWIVTFNGFLGFVSAQREENRQSRSFDVWVMNEYSVAESWTILHRVSLKPGILGEFLGIVRNRFYVREGDWWLVSYDLDSKDWKRYDISDRGVYSLVLYEESLERIIKSV